MPGPIAYLHPRSKHAQSLGSTRTPGSCTLLRWLKWIITSAENSACSHDAQTRPDTKHLHKLDYGREMGEEFLDLVEAF